MPAPAMSAPDKRQNVGVDHIAQQMLESTRSSLDQIASESGFACVETFRAVFRKRCGLGPSEYRDNFGFQDWKRNVGQADVEKL
jgi:transcriptional regulator GlxA family with amidase domain